LVIDTETDSKKVGAVALKDADDIPADLLILGVGVAPATKFLEASGFKLEKDQGITVDQYLRVEGEEDIFAIGDIAHYKQYPHKDARRVEHWNVAGNHVSRSRRISVIAFANEFFDVGICRAARSPRVSFRLAASRLIARVCCNSGDVLG
jgi:NADPH-dependent 2,4-dienoyl-CoA reductase/sulfur reductase-like enzyme